MNSRVATGLACLAVACLVGCGSSNDPSSGGKTPGDVDKTPDDSTAKNEPGEWTELISGNWNLDPGEEGYFCARKTIDEDTSLTFDGPRLISVADPDTDDLEVTVSVTGGSGGIGHPA